MSESLKSRLLSPEGNEIFKSFLLSREHDIACSLEDFGCLQGLFEEVFKRRAMFNIKRG